MICCDCGGGGLSRRAFLAGFLAATAAGCAPAVVRTAREDVARKIAYENARRVYAL